jgi:hypothetical protein
VPRTRDFAVDVMLGEATQNYPYQFFNPVMSRRGALYGQKPTPVVMTAATSGFECRELAGSR